MKNEDTLEIGNSISEKDEITQESPNAFSSSSSDSSSKSYGSNVAERFNYIENSLKDFKKEARILKNDSKEIIKSLGRSERRLDKNMTFMMIIATAIVIAVGITFLGMVFDFHKDNSKEIDILKIKIQKIEKELNK